MRSYAVVDLQFGSTGKGLLAAFLAYSHRPDSIVTAWGPNAGHTAYDLDGQKYVHTMLANGIVCDSVKRVYIGAGSVVNLDNLHTEILESMAKIDHEFPDIIMHPHAAIVTEEHRDAEAASMVGIGSTMKGTMAANLQKMQRSVEKTDQNVAIAKVHTHEVSRHIEVLKTHTEWLQHINDNVELLQIEGAQGYSLGVNSGYYPYTTSRECTVQQLLVDCSLPFHKPYTYGVCRTYPIRVANRYDEDGKMVGYSGPFHPESDETTFEDLQVPVELTTVTQLPRRIGTWSENQVVEAAAMNGVNEVFLNFVNYMEDEAASKVVTGLNSALEPLNAKVTLLGHGPYVQSIQDLRIPNTKQEEVSEYD